MVEALHNQCDDLQRRVNAAEIREAELAEELSVREGQNAALQHNLEDNDLQLAQAMQLSRQSEAMIAELHRKEVLDLQARLEHEEQQRSLLQVCSSVGIWDTSHTIILCILPIMVDMHCADRNSHATLSL